MTVPAKAELPEFLQRYPWMLQGVMIDSPSWEIGFAATGHPVSFTPSSLKVNEATVTHLRPAKIAQRWLTRGLLTGEGNQTKLSTNGKRLLSLILDEFPHK